MGFTLSQLPTCKHGAIKRLTLYYEDFKVVWKICVYCNEVLDKQYYIKRGKDYVRCEDCWRGWYS